MQMNECSRTRSRTPYRTSTNTIERTRPLFMFVHLTNRTEFLVSVRSFIKRTNINELPAERFTNYSLNVRFVYIPSFNCLQVAHLGSLIYNMPEIDQELSDAANSKVAVSFISTQKLISQGLLLVIHVQMAPGASVEDLKQHLIEFYEEEFVVPLAASDQAPNTKDVQGSNSCHINVFPDCAPGTAIIVSVIDKLVKGASGQALQNLNLMMGFSENVGLSRVPLPL
ncbi:putative N-acetyl-gamma-glutamyl-phosphate reductase [Helianthus annuus]|nr:putative N-acetyl-gamma-glutamyl-phosphate reductase [Helianthus annuus]